MHSLLGGILNDCTAFGTADANAGFLDDLISSHRQGKRCLRTAADMSARVLKPKFKRCFCYLETLQFLKSLKYKLSMYNNTYLKCYCTEEDENLASGVKLIKLRIYIY